jgi:competence protein ComEC
MVLLRPSPWALLVLAFLSALAVSWIRPSVAIVALAAAVALSLGVMRGNLSSTPALADGLRGQQTTVAGQVDDDPVTHRHGIRLVVRVATLHTRLLATVYGAPPVHYGDLVLLTGRLEAAPRFDTFDYASYLADHGISGILQSPHLVRVLAHPGDPLHTAIFAIRHALVAGIDRALPEPQAALLLGVVFGYRQALPRALEQQMIACGLIHIVVISGLKVSLLARIVHQGVGRLAPGIAPAVALGAMLTYALVSGASAAALRAAAMGGLVVLAGTLHRETQVVASMALTAAVMLGLDPSLARDVSFQLSFAGTLGIAGLTDAIAARLPFLPAVLRDPFAATLAAEAATWPLMLASFHQVSLVAPVANALVLPLLPAVMVIGGSGAILAALWQAAGWPVLQLAGLIIAWFERVIEVTAAAPAASLTTPYFPPRWIAAAAILNGGGLAALKLRRFFWQRRVWAGLGGLALVIGALLLVQPDGQVHVYALDVGTGSGVLIRTPTGQQILFDGGPDPDRFAQAVGRVLPPTARGLRLWLLTGGRRAQVGAAPAVMRRFDITQVLVTDSGAWSPSLLATINAARQAGIPVSVDTIPPVIDGVTLRLAADGRTWLVDAGGAALAIIPPDTGWVSYPAQIRAAIFLDGGPEAWTSARVGDLAVIQVANQSRDGLPAHDFLRDLDLATVLRTDRVGTVELTIVGSRFLSP